MDLSKLGIITFLDALQGKETGQFARRVEQLGYSVLWVPDAMGREVFSLSSYLLSQTDRLIVGPGVVIVYAYEPIAIANAARTLGELFPDRFILGLGVSNREANARRGIAYEKPASFVREYLAKMKAAPYGAPAPQHEPPIVLSGMMPKMLQLAATETRGTLTYFTTTEQVARIRQALAANPWLCAIQAVLLETEATKARALARRYMQTYLAIDHYVHRLRSLGYSEADFANGGSDRLVDALVAWGNEDKLRERIADQFKVGATHVCILPLNPRGEARPDERVIEALAPR
ncbi:MAG TPA: TIGR03620 family F420-dependent LLM class oxidoreductase [Candidatus Binatia bacterium]|jgi:probable F420-dependent oxidoreductase|nr:TIGR03620 family F420-dependent LLM class oxidoreductase [Candidatus Binatia bacterium]